MGTLLVTLPIVTLAGAWNQGKGKGYSQFSFTYLKYDHLLNGNSPHIDLKRSIGDYTFQGYLEYGLTNSGDLIAILPYKWVTSGEDLLEPENDPFAEDTLESGSLHGLANITLGWKQRIHQGKYVWSGQLFVSNPGTQYDEATGLRIGYDAWTVTPWLLVGRGFGKVYGSAGLGYQWRNNNYAHNLVGELEIGTSLEREGGKTWFIFRTDIKMPITDGTFDEGNSVQTGLFRDNSSYMSPGLKINHYFGTQWSVNVGGYGAFWSELEGGAATWNFGISYQW